MHFESKYKLWLIEVDTKAGSTVFNCLGCSKLNGRLPVKMFVDVSVSPKNKNTSAKCI